MGNATYYDRFTTRMEMARQAGVCYYTPVLLKDKATVLKLGDYDALDTTVQKRIIEQVEQEYLAYLFLNNSSNKLHSQLKMWQMITPRGTRMPTPPTSTRLLL